MAFSDGELAFEEAAVNLNVFADDLRRCASWKSFWLAARGGSPKGLLSERICPSCGAIGE